ncbi:tRNA 2-selenouridine synthase [compost metagenome]
MLQCAAFVAAHGTVVGADLFGARLLESLDKLAKRLGGSLHQTLRDVMVRALALQKVTGTVDMHRDWITVLMRQYYDPMYAFQRNNRAERVVFEGEEAAVLGYLRERSVGGSR